MLDILGIQPYPFHLAIARELHLTLCQLFPSAKGAVFAAQRAGIAPHMINADQMPYLVWKDVLEYAANAGLTRELAACAVRDFPNGPAFPFLNALLLRQTPVIQREPRGTDGKPAFRHGNDDVTEPEALLFHDDLSLPVGRLGWLVELLKKLRELVPAVCRLEVSCAVGIGSGTAFRIAPDWLLTNHHVLYPEGNTPTLITATFGYEDNADGTLLAGEAFKCDVASIQSDQGDDWGIVRTSQQLPATIPTIRLDTSAVPESGQPAFIIQHPRGARKRVGYARNRITFVGDAVVQYLTDTEAGSSGSPVFDSTGRLISLHHAGGRPQEVAGQAPLKKNEGIRIERVLAGITKAGVAL